MTGWQKNIKRKWGKECEKQRKKCGAFKGEITLCVTLE